MPSSDHRPILATIHLPTENLAGGTAHLGLKEGNLAAFTSAVDEQLRGSGLTDDDSLTQMYRPFCKAVLAAARRHIGLKAVGMTGENCKT